MAPLANAAVITRNSYQACEARDGAALKHLTTLHIETFRNKVVPYLERMEQGGPKMAEVMKH